MAAPPNFQKAELRVEGQGKIPVLFNPKEYSIAKSNAWQFKAAVGNDAPKGSFGGGNSRVLTLNGLLLDQSLLGPKGSIKDTADKLFGLMRPSVEAKGKGKAKSGLVPPYVTFAWGQVVTFQAVIMQMTIAFKLFAPNGNPIRAEVNMTLNEAGNREFAPPQNPTTRANAEYGVHIVRDGDSLQSIAYKTYGDATAWRRIADANDVHNPFALRRGTALSLPGIDT